MTAAADAQIIRDVSRFLDVYAQIPPAKAIVHCLFVAIPEDSRPKEVFDPRGIASFAPDVSPEYGARLVRYEQLGIRNGLTEAIDRESALHDENSEIITRLAKAEPRTLAAAIALVRAMAAELRYCINVDDWEGEVLTKIERTMDRAAELVGVDHG